MKLQLSCKVWSDLPRSSITSPNIVNIVKGLFLEESFEGCQANLTSLVTKLVQNEDHQQQSPAQQMILDKVESIKAALVKSDLLESFLWGVEVWWC